MERQDEVGRHEGPADREDHREEPADREDRRGEPADRDDRRGEPARRSTDAVGTDTDAVGTDTDAVGTDTGAERTDGLDERELAALQSVSHGAMVSIPGIAVQKVLEFLFNLVLTQGLTVSQYGVFSLGEQIARILGRLGPVGANESLLRFIPKYRDDPARRNRIVGLASVTALVISALLGAALFVLSEPINELTIGHAAFPTVIELFALWLPFNVFLSILVYLFRALELVEHQVFLDKIAHPGARLVAAALAIALGLTVVGVVAALVIATAVVMVGAVVLSYLRTAIRPTGGWTRREAVEYYDHAAPNTVSQVGQIFQSRIDIVLVGYFLTADAAGIYYLAIFLSSIVIIPLLSFNQLLPPIASKLHSEGRHDLLNSVYSTITRLVFTGAAIVVAVQLIYRAELLALFGESYVEGSLVLAVLALGQMANSAVGATMWLLLMTDHQYVRMVNTWVLGALNVSFSYVFILEFGLVGAALGTAASTAIINFVRLFELWHLERLQPFTWTFLKPIVATAAAAAVMIAVRPVLDGTALLAVGSLVGLLTFALTLSALGIERRDRALFAVLAAEYRQVLAGLRK